MKLASKYLMIFGAAAILAIIVKNANGFATALKSVGSVANTNFATIATAGAKVPKP